MRDVFFEAFETYETGCAPVIGTVRSPRGFRLARRGPGRQTQLLRRAAAAMLDELEAGWQKKGDMEDEKIVFCDLLSCRWCASSSCRSARNSSRSCRSSGWSGIRSPPFYLGDYESISGGFRKKILGLCFITTAVCQELGKARRL